MNEGTDDILKFLICNLDPITICDLDAMLNDMDRPFRFDD